MCKCEDGERCGQEKDFHDDTCCHLSFYKDENSKLKQDINGLMSNCELNHAGLDLENEKLKRVLCLVLDQHHDVLDQFVYDEVWENCGRKNKRT